MPALGPHHYQSLGHRGVSAREAPATAAKHPRASQHSRAGSWEVTNVQVIKFLSGRHDLTQQKLVETKGFDPSNTHLFLHLMKCSNEHSSIALICWKKSVLYMLKNKSNGINIL